MIIFLPMSITANTSIVTVVIMTLNYFFDFGNIMFAVHTIVILYPIVYVHISVTYSYTVSVSVKESV